MPRYWTNHWRNIYWNEDSNLANEPVSCSGGSQFRRRGIARGDRVYIVSILAGRLLLGGRMTVDRIVPLKEALRITGSRSLYDAPEWIVGQEGSGTPLNLHRQLAPEVTRRLRCVTASGEKGFFFIPGTDSLDAQATRGVRELTMESAELLDRIISATDVRPPSRRASTAPEAMLRAQKQSPPGQAPNHPVHVEGALERVMKNAYERDPAARAACLRHYGLVCAVCNFKFETAYGRPFAGLIHVHHLTPLAEFGGERPIDPVADLRPVCPNCHTALHHREPPYTIEEMRRFLRRAGPPQGRA